MISDSGVIASLFMGTVPSMPPVPPISLSVFWESFIVEEEGAVG